MCEAWIRTRQSRPVLELSDLQRSLAVLPVEDVRHGNVVQGVVLQGRRGRVKLGAEGQRVGGAVSGSRADGANPFGGGLHGDGRAFVEAVLFGPAGAASLGRRLRRLHQQLGRVWRGGQGGAEQEVLVLGQVLSRGLLGRTCTVKQLPLQQGEVRLRREKKNL